MDVAGQVKAVLAEETGVPVAELADDRRLDDLTLDSLIVLNLMFEVEKQCKVSIRDQDLSGIETVGDMIKIVQDLRSHVNGTAA